MARKSRNEDDDEVMDDDAPATGRVKAPLGSIAVNATGSITLAPTSTLSVAGAGLVPYGTVLNGNVWTYNAPPNNASVPIGPFTVASASGVSSAAKSIRLSAPNIDAQPGSVLDIAGGGDLLGTGFVAGPGNQPLPFGIEDDTSPRDLF